MDTLSSPSECQQNEYLVYICCTLTGSDTVSTNTGVSSVNNNSPVFLRLQLKTEGFCPNSVGVTVSVSGSGSLQSSNTSRGTTSSWSGSWEREPSGRSFLLSATTWHRTKRRYMWQSRYRPGSCPLPPPPPEKSILLAAFRWSSLTFDFVFVFGFRLWRRPARAAELTSTERRSSSPTSSTNTSSPSTACVSTATRSLWCSSTWSTATSTSFSGTRHLPITALIYGQVYGQKVLRQLKNNVWQHHLL